MIASIELQLGGQAEFDWRSEGLICRLSVPLIPEAAMPQLSSGQLLTINGNGSELASRTADA